MQGGVEHGGGGYTGYVTMQIANYVIKLITSPQPSAARRRVSRGYYRIPRVDTTLCTGEGIVFTQ